MTYVALQLAFHLGFRQVVLVGVDHQFTTRGLANTTVVSEGDDPNHFSPGYLGRGFRWQLPRPRDLGDRLPDGQGCVPQGWPRGPRRHCRGSPAGVPESGLRRPIPMKPAPQASGRGWTACVVALLMLGAALRLVNIHAPPLDFHSTRQMRNALSGTLHLLRPRPKCKSGATRPGRFVPPRSRLVRTSIFETLVGATFVLLVHIFLRVRASTGRLSG